MNLRDTWQQLTTQTLEDWKANHQPEDLHLDFKLLLKAPEFTKDDNKNLAKAVSGFANSDGGIIVWGIDARKVDGMNTVADLIPLSDANAVVARLNELTGQASTPIVDGVEHRAILDSSGVARFVATYVPASDTGPHMAKLGVNQYYKRSGESFYPMEHFDIADMFGRRMRPALALRLIDFVGASVGQNPPQALYTPVVAIENTGRGIARFPFLHMWVGQPYYPNQEFKLGHGVNGLPERPQVSFRNGRIYAGGTDDVVHPGTVLQVQRLGTKLRIDESTKSFDDLTIEYELTCEGMRPIRDTFVHAGEEILKFVKQDLRLKFPAKCT